jgi:uncharacterized protein (TIGR03663 family)
MTKSAKWRTAFLGAILLAGLLRLPWLAARPMHNDEAVGGVKFSRLFDENYYRYDPSQYHGPTLGYFTLIPAYLSGAGDSTELSESSLRAVPVIFGLMLVAMAGLACGGLGMPAALLAALFAAVSPALVFYSRFYVHEMILVTFTFGLIFFGWRYAATGRGRFALAAGACAGMMHATKETCIIAFGSMAFALAVLSARKDFRNVLFKRLKSWYLPASVLAAAAVSAIFFSSFFDNAGGVIDSFAGYGRYFQRASTGDEIHLHPWYYYLKMLLFWRCGDGPSWSEALTVILAATGFVFAFGRGDRSRTTGFHRFIAIYTFAMLAVYSAIPYKTPWCMLGFLHGMTLLAGLAGAELFGMLRRPAAKVILCAVLTLGAGHLTWQAFLGSFRYSDDPVNPYVYAHTGPDIFPIVRRIKQAAAAGDGTDTYIQVICPGDDYWPLPWYLRSYKRISWQQGIDPSMPPAPVIVLDPAVEADLAAELYRPDLSGRRELYVALFEEYRQLRPGRELRGYIARQLWEKMLAGDN